MARVFKGIRASRGVCMGPVHVFYKKQTQVTKRAIEKTEIAGEQARIRRLFADYIAELEGTLDSGSLRQSIIDIQVELLKDPYFSGMVTQHIAAEEVNAEWALKEVVDSMMNQILSLEDVYFRERAMDYRDLGENLLSRLTGQVKSDLSDLDQDYIIVAEELAPSDTSTMDTQHILGFANDLGGKTSHTSIIAQTLGLPALVGMKEISQQVREGQLAIIDAYKGIMILDPLPTTILQYQEILDREARDRIRLEAIKQERAVTQDQHAIEVAANIGSLQDLDLALESGADGIGLFRTEFLYMQGDRFPTEGEQFKIYKEAAERLKGAPLLIRTSDIGGDKDLPYFSFPREDNPFLGWRAIRLSLSMPSLFNDQLRAILRASAYGNVKILLPMVISPEEILEVRQRIEELKEVLDEEGIPFNRKIPIGIMIETPASVLLADQLALYVDFFSIGTNDLTQYVLAVDRGNENISSLYDTYHPAVLRAIDQTIRAAHKEKIPCGMCGAFAGDPEAAYLLMGMGLDELSTPPAMVPRIKDTILKSNYQEARAFAKAVLKCGRAEEVRALMEERRQAGLD